MNKRASKNLGWGVAVRAIRVCIVAISVALGAGIVERAAAQPASGGVPFPLPETTFDAQTRAELQEWARIY